MLLRVVSNVNVNEKGEKVPPREGFVAVNMDNQDWCVMTPDEHTLFHALHDHDKAKRYLVV